MTLQGKNVLVFGMGISGRGVASLLKRAGVSMVLYDGNEGLDKDKLLSELGLESDTKVILGELCRQDLENIDILALSPGISINAPYVCLAAESGIKILGELELAYELSKGRVIAITGTNGKTTTTALTGEIMKSVCEDVFVVGNIGKSYASVAMDTGEKSVIVAEVSSFQLESIETFHPSISAILNITPDHLDRHGSFENYAECKMNIARNQTADDVCVINYDDKYLVSLSHDIAPKIIYFSRLEKLDNGVYLDGDVIVYSDGKQARQIIGKNDINLMGNHNIENIMASVGIAAAAGVPVENITSVISSFQAVEHRIEFVRNKNGVDYYNDSKGTNTDAASKAVESMVSPTILIAGGYDKGADFTDFINGFNGKVKEMILIGTTAQKIRDTAEKCGFSDIYMAKNLEHAVSIASQHAQTGDAVLLSPACASWDQFKSYEQRGRMFKEYVNRL